MQKHPGTALRNHSEADNTHSEGGTDLDYRIGDVSRLLGISSDLLRYYEKKGVVHPRKGEKNNYRYYESWDIDFLLDCLWFKNFDFSMEEIARLISECDYESLTRELAAKEIELEDQLRRRELLLEKYRDHLAEMRRGRELLGKCDMGMSPETLYYINRHDFVYDDDPFLISLTRTWLQYSPFIRRCFEIRQPDLPGGEGSGTVSWGLSLNPEDSREIPIFIHDAVEHLIPHNCVHSVFKSTGKDAFTTEHLRYIMDYAAEKGLSVCGSAYGHLLFSVREDGGQTGYYEVWVPVE